MLLISLLLKKQQQNLKIIQNKLSHFDRILVVNKKI